MKDLNKQAEEAADVRFPRIDRFFDKRMAAARMHFCEGYRAGRTDHPDHAELTRLRERVAELEKKIFNIENPF